MKKYRNILAFLGSATGDTRALEAASHLAQLSGGAVVATRVIDFGTSKELDWAPDGWELHRAEVVAAEQQHLSARLAGLSPSAVPVAARLSVGRPSVELIRDVLEYGHDLVIKVAAGVGAGRRTSFGSIGLHLARKSPAPVWLLPRSAPPPKRILAAVHPGIDGDEARFALSQRVLSHASALAAAFGAELHVAHAHEGLPRGMTSDSRTTKLLHRIGLTEQSVTNRLSALLAELPTPAQLHLLHGEPETTLTELSRSLEIHTLVMASVGRSGIAGLLIDDLAEELLLRLDCGVFCVKPAGFQTPVLARHAAKTS